ncbi:MAG: CHAD domain-containing protein [Thermomicrobiales bacterium]|nr:CHAD domain-containing protein [Thermomicrobiales bacterium]
MTEMPKAGDRFDHVMARLIDERWQDVWDAIPVAVAGDDPEGVHDVRVASRRLRAAMDVASDLFPASWYRPLHKMAKRITSELGEVRDRDVQIEYFTNVRDAAAPGDQPGIDRLIARLTAEREEARQHMLAFLDDLEQTGLQQEVSNRFGQREQSS